MGDFDHNGYDDLAIGVPGEDSGAGAVAVLYGSNLGLTPSDDIWRQGGSVGGSPEASDWLGMLRRFALGAAPGIAVAYAIGYGIPGTEVMTAVLWGIAVGGTWIIWLERRLWPLALNGALAFCLGYTLLVKLVLSLTPDFMQAWGVAYQPHVWVWGIPLYEMAWAAAFGAVWPLFAGWCFGTELLSKSD